MHFIDMTDDFVIDWETYKEMIPDEQEVERIACGA
jgi:hypothetical protein